jgi:hypothetical protein
MVRQKKQTWRRIQDSASEGADDSNAKSGKQEESEEVEGEEDDVGIEEELYIVEKILDKKKERGKVLYKVKWEGYPLD